MRNRCSGGIVKHVPLCYGVREEGTLCINKHWYAFGLDTSPLPRAPQRSVHPERTERCSAWERSGIETSTPYILLASLIEHILITYDEPTFMYTILYVHMKPTMNVYTAHAHWENMS